MIGVFVFSKKTAPAKQEPLLRYGSDIFVVWNADDIGNDVILKSATCLAKALCVRESKAREAEAADFQAIDNAILAIEKEAKRLESIKTWTETITSNNGKILDEIRKMSAALDRQLQILKEALSGFKESAVQESLT